MSCSPSPAGRRSPAHVAKLALLVLALSAPASGQTPADTPESRPPSSDEPAAEPETAGPLVLHDSVTVIGSADDLVRATGSAFVITSAELVKFAPTNVHQALRVVPGVYLREEDGLGTFPRIGIRASASGRSDRISILEDGIPAAMAAYANTSAYYFPNISRMESIEVLTGPQVLFHGPQTTSGAINLISTPVPERAGGTVRAEFGEYASRNLRAHYGASGAHLGVLLETVQRGTDGFMRKDRSALDSGNRIQEYLGKVRWRNTARSQQVDVKLFHSDEDADVSYLGLTDEDYRADPNRRYGLSELERMRRGRTSSSVRHRADLRPATSLNTTVYWMRTRRDYRRLNQINGVGIGASGATWIVNQDQPGAGLLRDILHGTADTTHANGIRYGNNFQRFTSTGAQTELRHALMSGRVGHLLTAGIRWHQDVPENTATIANEIYDQVNGSLVFRTGTPGTPSKGRARALAFWAGDRIGLGRWHLLPIVRVEHVDTKADTAAATSNENSLTRATAGLGVNYALTPRVTLLAGVHQGFAPPGSNVPQGSRGEESTNVEGGVRMRQGAAWLDVIGFHSGYSNALRNCLVANPCGGGIVDGTEQAGAKVVRGLQVSAAAPIYAHAAFRVPLLLAYTWTGGEYTRASDLPSGVQAGDVLDYTPAHAGSVQLGLEGVRRWSAWAAVTYTASACVTTTCGRPGVDTRFLSTDDLVSVDLSGSVGLTSGVEAYAKVENVFDARKITHRGADGARGNPARYVGGGLRVGF
jgi:Fe(3+) dicitrate transport protein